MDDCQKDCGPARRNGWWFDPDGKRRNRILLALLGMLGLACWAPPATGAAQGADPTWDFHETPLFRGASDQLGPAIDGGYVYFRDLSVSGGSLVRVDPATGTAVPLFSGTGVSAGPDAGGGSVVWQDGALNACLGTAAGDANRCLALPAATDMALAGLRAVSAHPGNTIRLVNFETMRSKILDSSTTSGGRYDPDIEGDRAVWVKERGYAGKYYEPLIVSYNLLTDTLTYETRIGGGSSSAGESLYERRRPELSGGRIVYQQRRRGAGDWDIYETEPDSFGRPLVDAPGDQASPSLDGRYLVYQDNRAAGEGDGNAPVSGAWDIYLKDLVSGEELPVCTAGGDQVNPVVRGNLIVWEDSRNGDWDIYAATISPHMPPPPAPVEEPRLALLGTSAIWESYSQYLAGELTVRFTVADQGPGKAFEVALRRVSAWPLSVTHSDSLPAAEAEMAPGQRAVFETRFHLPSGTRRFQTSVTASCLDAAGNELWFPRPLSG